MPRSHMTMTSAAIAARRLGFSKDDNAAKAFRALGHKCVVYSLYAMFGKLEVKIVRTGEHTLTAMHRVTKPGATGPVMHLEADKSGPIDFRNERELIQAVILSLAGMAPESRPVAYEIWRGGKRHELSARDNTPDDIDNGFSSFPLIYQVTPWQ